MKKFLLSAAVAALLPLSVARADTVTFLDTMYDGNLGGGEFTAQTNDFGTFTTFCMEYTASLYMNYEYVYTLSNAAQTGGKNHANTPGYDVVSQGTAYLYELFRFNNLPDYATTAAIHDVNAGYLQKAFWALEDEWTFANAGGLANPYLAMAVDKFGTFAAAQDDYTGTNVRVMNIDTAPGKTDGLTGTKRQDQLVYVPDSASTIAMFGLALLTLGAVRWRLS